MARVLIVNQYGERTAHLPMGPRTIDGVFVYDSQSLCGKVSASFSGKITERENGKVTCETCKTIARAVYEHTEPEEVSPRMGSMYDGATGTTTKYENEWFPRVYKGTPVKS